MTELAVKPTKCDEHRSQNDDYFCCWFDFCEEIYEKHQPNFTPLAELLHLILSIYFYFLCILNQLSTQLLRIILMRLPLALQEVEPIVLSIRSSCRTNELLFYIKK